MLTSVGGGFSYSTVAVTSTFLKIRKVPSHVGLAWIPRAASEYGIVEWVRFIQRRFRETSTTIMLDETDKVPRLRRLLTLAYVEAEPFTLTCMVQLSIIVTM